MGDGDSEEERMAEVEDGGVIVGEMRGRDAAREATLGKRTGAAD